MSTSSQTKDDIIIEESPRYNIIVWNDDKSDFELVAIMIATIFNYKEIEAIEITKKIHDEGNSVVFTNCKEICEFRLQQCEKFKKENIDFLRELRVTLEKVS